MKRLLPLALLGTTALGCTPTHRYGWPTPAALEAGADVHASAPAPGPEPAFVAPVPREAWLGNGLRVLSVSKRDLPLVHVHVMLRGGSALDPADKAGLASFYSEMLRAGTESLGPEALADAFESLGSSLHVEADGESIDIYATALSEHTPRLLELIADVVLHPAFAPEEIERVRKRLLIGLAQESDSPQGLASRLFWHALYGAHPYGHAVSGVRQALESISRDDLVTFGAKVAQAKNATLVLAGDFDAAAPEALAQTSFGGWQRGARLDDVATPADNHAGLYLLDKPGAPQSQLRVGEVAVARKNADHDALVLMNAILGGSFNSRINMNLREDKGYTYGAFSHFIFMREKGPFGVMTGVRTDATADSIAQILKEIRAIREAPVTQAELVSARNLYVLSLPSAFQTIGSLAGSVAQLALYDLPLDYFRTLPARLAAVTPAEILRVAQAHLDPSRLAVVIVGDATSVAPTLAPLGLGTPTPTTTDELGL